jgi:putative transposase
MSRIVFKYRLYPTKKQEQTLLFFLRRCRDLYNSALEERRAAYQMRRISLSCFDQIDELPDLKQAFPAYQDVPSHVLQDVLRRLDKTFVAFFRRVRNGETPGYPRFKSTSRYHSFTYPDGAGWKLQGDRLKLTGVGEVKVRLHRERQGTIKTVTIRRDVDQWYVTFSCEVELEAPLPPSQQEVGLDLGVMRFATLSTGEMIENPRHLRRGLKQIKRLSQLKDRRKKGSHRRKRAAIALAKAHRKVRNQRANFHHQLSRRLVNEYGLIAMEDLKISTMTKAPEPKPDPAHDGQYLPNGKASKAGLNQSILDAGWGQFQQFCTVKAERAGRRVVLVDPYNTSQLCSGCGRLVPKDLDVRWHSCPYPDCGTELDRDHNAAITILCRGQEVAHSPTGL